MNNTRVTKSLHSKTISAQEMECLTSNLFIDTTGVPFYIQSEWIESELERVVPILTREEIRQTLVEFEQKYQMPSREFYQRWREGKMHGIDIMKWAVLWEMWEGWREWDLV
jgi:hypothetical protein